MRRALFGGVLVVMAIACGTAVLAAPLTDQQYEFLFSRFVEQYGKEYELSSFFKRYNTFRANLDAVMTHNGHPTPSSYKLAMNQFGDLSQDEFKTTILKLKPINNFYLRSFNQGNHSHITLKDDEAYDWRNQNGVTPVKNQGQCGSCWAFSAVASIETSHFAAKGKLVDLSEQQLVDCAGSYGNNACNGGLMDSAFEYVVGNGGICTEASYPYAGKKNKCKKSCKLGTKLKGYKSVKPMDEDDLAKAVKLTTVAIAIEASQLGFQFYSSGVFDGKCGTQLDHGVAVVGFGTDDGKGYWTIRNSWGKSWGEEGYIRMIRGKNQCGLAQMPSYAVIA